MTAELLMLLGGAAAFGLTVYWVRRRELGERFALGWLALATALLVCGVFPSLLEGLASAARLSYPAAVLFLALAVIYLFAFQVSVALTALHRRSIRLLQQVALLEHRVRELEARDQAVPPPEDATVGAP